MTSKEKRRASGSLRSAAKCLTNRVNTSWAGIWCQGKMEKEMKTTKNLLAVVEVLATSSDSVTPTEIALQLELTRHQTQRILKDLCESGWAQSHLFDVYERLEEKFSG